MLKDKVAIISGSSRGIGKAIALKFAKMGAKVVLNHRKSDKEITVLSEQLEDLGAEYLVFKGSVADRPFVKDMIKEIKVKWKKIDVLVNNAGIIKDMPLLMMSEKDWDNVLDVNLKGTFYLTKESISTMMAQKDGRIINISSLTAISGREGQTNYGAAKAGILGFTKSLGVCRS
ncbi:MAG: SDR family NAD(P)-dependent oxidoreductase [bacterium]|nr:SDR family NAD(P)-dependent oxidoreductase [bacterium]